MAVEGGPPQRGKAQISAMDIVGRCALAKESYDIDVTMLGGKREDRQATVWIDGVEVEVAVASGQHALDCCGVATTDRCAQLRV
jgi:hypothetical protein